MRWIINNKGNILIIGANQAALVLAEFLGKSDFDVTVFEKKKREDVSYDWHDNMTPSTFDSIGIPLPPKNCYLKKKCWTFVTPFKSDCLYIDLPEDKLDVTLDRKLLNDFLYDRAKDYAKFRYETEVKELFFEGDTVKGIILSNGEKLYADLVVDISGVNSIFRKSLPLNFGIQNEIDKKDLFVVYRAIFDINSKADKPLYTNKVYMKHMGEQGIAWFIYDEDNKTTDVLIGRVGKISQDTVNYALNDLRKDNPLIGQNIIKGGQIYEIPVRHPISMMVSDGYVLLGDSAFMTIPMMGSGMACGMMAAKILIEVLSNPFGDTFKKENLYRYQVEYMQKIGAKNSGINMMKNWLLETPSEIIDFFMVKRIIGEKELAAGGSGQSISLSKKDIFEKVKRGFLHLPTLLKLKSLTEKMKIQMSVAENIPKKYDKKAVDEWQIQYNKNFE